MRRKYEAELSVSGGRKKVRGGRGQTSPMMTTSPQAPPQSMLSSYSEYPSGE